MKEVFDRRVGEMLKMPENQKIIRRIFRDFDFNRVKEYPLPILIILLKEQSSAEGFRQFLLTMDRLTTRDVNLVFQYLCQIDLADHALLGKLANYEPMKSIVGLMLHPDLASESPGYLGLPAAKALKLCTMPHVVEQVRYRVSSERTGSYSVALNHLLNELHGICHALDGTCEPKEYDADRVVSFLNSRQVPPSACAGIRKLFDRRNTNQVSHPGSEGHETWGVAADEYGTYRLNVERCLDSLL